MPRYRLLSEDGADFGLFQAAHQAKRSGEEIHRVTGEVFMVTRVVSAMDSDDIDGYLIVKLMTGGRLHD